MSSKPVFVATHPRACSTAFERVFMTRRNSLQCVHEPFGDAFYYGPERLGSRFEGDEKAKEREESGFSQSTFKTILDRLDREGEEGKRVFIKDITHYLVPPSKQDARLAPSLYNPKRGVDTNGGANDGDSGIVLSDSQSHPGTPKNPPFPYSTPSEPNNPTVIPKEILEKFHFTFLIRHPRNAIPSYYRCCVPPLVEKTGFHEFMPSEAGYDELRRVFDYCKDTGIVGPAVCGEQSGAEANNGQVEICVIDADDLLDDPEGILRQYCTSINVPFCGEMLKWNDEDQLVAKEAFEKWNGFHEDAIHSTDLKPRQHHKAPKSDEQLFADWKEKYGQKGAEIIRDTVAENVADYEYLKGFAIKPMNVNA
ncbi:hypothetical protein B0A48_16504 [Cryoendolithus antarcticus]|uniref:Sulfotransferase domain-containing protein n=1 Tax=Cryoendolithus antarcticus TaxID=1507870 RepID=A0A1V8SF87_9PEZI|nr:hypothetical protein B0A48_16504 [Cryoendolithus antarcticus]